MTGATPTVERALVVGTTPTDTTIDAVRITPIDAATTTAPPTTVGSDEWVGPHRGATARPLPRLVETVSVEPVPRVARAPTDDYMPPPAEGSDTHGGGPPSPGGAHPATAGTEGNGGAPQAPVRPAGEDRPCPPVGASPTRAIGQAALPAPSGDFATGHRSPSAKDRTSPSRATRPSTIDHQR